MGYLQISKKKSWWKIIRRIIFWSLLLYIVGWAIRGYLKPKEYLRGTPEYFSAHGIVHGKENIVRILGMEHIYDLMVGGNLSLFPRGGVLFRFPANLAIVPYTEQAVYVPKEGETVKGLSTAQAIEQDKVRLLWRGVVKGQAETIWFMLNDDEQFSPSSKYYSESSIGGINVTIGNRAATALQVKERIDSFKKADLVQDVSELELKKVVFLGRPGITDPLVDFVAKNKIMPNGQPLVMGCNARMPSQKNLVTDVEIYGCTISYRRADGVSVQYSFPLVYLQRWREMHQAIDSFIDKCIVKQAK